MKKIYLTWLFTLVAWVAAVPVVLGQTIARDRVAVAPYAQVVPGGPTAGGFYSFLAISHPSLSQSASSIDITVSYEGPDSSLIVNGDAGRSTNFAVGAGETHKVFIVGTNHPTVNPTTNSVLNNTRTHFITTVGNAATNGNVRVLATRTNPSVPDGNGNFDNLNQLAMWGVIFHESNSAGFAMEFVGDMHDSTILSTGNGSNVVTTNTGRGIN